MRLPHVEDRAPLLAQIEAHLQEIETLWAKHEIEAIVVVWPAGKTRYLARARRLDGPLFCREMRRFSGLPPVAIQQALDRYTVS